MSPTESKRVHNVHPFPARMAPDLALDKIVALTQPGARVLDPMCGSGTVPRLAKAKGRLALACDMDPLAVMMTRTACTPSWAVDLQARAERLVGEASRLSAELPSWIAKDKETREFIDYWFAPSQQIQLGKLAILLHLRPRTDDPLRVALSRIIVTKSGGASLARDTSHSRPHRVKLENDFDVYSAFVTAAAKIEQVIAKGGSQRNQASIRTVDARNLYFIERGSIDLIVTSPPYLNAIDYLRGHRLSLVWLGWNMQQLRSVRGDSIGAERGLKNAPSISVDLTKRGVPNLDDLPPREQRMIWRYTYDMIKLCRSLARVSKEGSHLVFVVADSVLKGVPVSNSALCKLSALAAGFELSDSTTRPLPVQHRYLPPPDSETGTLGTRMRQEAVLTFRRRAI